MTMIKLTLKINRKGLFLLCSLFTSSFISVFGQIEFKEEKERIALIKRDNTYVSGEGFGETIDEAFLIAMQNLQSVIRHFINERKVAMDMDESVIQERSTKIQIKRGNQERVFLYIHKNDIFSGAVKSDTCITSIPKQDEIKHLDALEEANEIEADESALSLILQTVATTATEKELRDYLETQAKRKTLIWGEMASEINPLWYIVAIRDNKVKAVFEQGMMTRFNLLSGEKESLNTYRDCRKIWFIVFEEE